MKIRYENISMKIDRKKNAIRGTIVGIFTKLYQMVLPFITRTIIIQILGKKYAGLNGLFTSILQVLNLAELGVGATLVFSMYKPIVDDDKKKLCQLLELYKKYYFYIGFFVLIAGIIVMPFLPFLIKEVVPNEINIYIIYLMTLIPTILSYWMFSYRGSLLSAYQREDIISLVNMVSETIKTLLQIGVLLLFKSYYLFLAAVIISQIFQNILILIVTVKKYPDIIPNGELSKEEKKKISEKVRDLFTAKLGGTITNAADSIVISACLGLTMLALYQNYFYVLSAVIALFNVFYCACRAGIGNSLIIGNKKQNYEIFEKFFFIAAFAMCIATCCFASLFQPFIELWMGSGSLLDYKIVVLLCAYFYVYEIAMPFAIFKDAAGIWKQDRFRPLIGGIVNLAVNLFLVRYLGLYGVLLSTVISYLLINIPWLMVNSFKYIFNQKIYSFLPKLLYYSVLTVFISVMTFHICKGIQSGSLWKDIFLKLLICTIIPGLFFMCTNIRTKEGKYFVGELLKWRRK